MKSNILWQKVSDEVGVPGALTPEESTRLETVFSISDPNSPWQLAIQRLGMKLLSRENPAIRVILGTPFFNASMLTQLVSHGALEPTPDSSLKIQYKSKFSLIGALQSFLTQWRIESVLASIENQKPPADSSAQIGESVLLGLVLQALMLRLPGRSEEKLAAWLANPASAPAGARDTVSKILLVQRRRTQMSSAWTSLWLKENQRRSPATLPDYFWNEPAPEASVVASPQDVAPLELRYSGIPISPGEVEGHLVLIDKIPFNTPNPLPPLPRILVFARAHPDSVLLFPDSTAVVFAEGGALAHACCVAREQNLPCVSGVGKKFLLACKKAQDSSQLMGQIPTLRISGTSGSVEILPQI